MAEPVDQVAMGYLKKYGRKVAIDWPIQGLKYGALGALAIGGAGYMAASALTQKARSLFGGREVASYDPSAAAAKKKEGNFFSRMLQSHIQETLAHEVSRTMSLLAAINQASRLRHEMGGDVMIDMEKAMDRGEYLNPKIADKHPRFEMKTVRTWEYDEHWLVSATGRRARICVQGYLDEKADLDREVEEKAERRQRAKERKKMGLKPEEETEGDKNKQAEKTFNWHFVHISVFFDNDSRQLILTHDAEAGEDLIVLPDAEWPGQERSGRGAPHGASADVDDAWSDEEDEDTDALRQRRPKAPQFIDAEVVQPKAANKNNKKR